MNSMGDVIVVIIVFVDYNVHYDVVVGNNYHSHVHDHHWEDLSSASLSKIIPIVWINTALAPFVVCTCVDRA